MKTPKEREEDTEHRLLELEKFKQKIEVGSWIIRCAAYTIGALAVFFVSLLPWLEKWFSK